VAVSDRVNALLAPFSASRFNDLEAREEDRASEAPASLKDELPLTAQEEAVV
jgi:hypothetical protein